MDSSFLIMKLNVLNITEDKITSIRTIGRYFVNDKENEFISKLILNQFQRVELITLEINAHAMLAVIT